MAKTLPLSKVKRRLPELIAAVDEREPVAPPTTP